MVEVTEIIEDPESEPKTEIPQSQERLLDADEIESFYLPKSTNDNVNIRPSVKAHLESLVLKIRRDAKALKRMEDSIKRQELEKQKQEDQVQVQDQVQKKEEEVQKEKIVEKKTNDTIEEPTASTSAPTCVFPTPTIMKYKSIDKFAFDAGSYDSPTVTIYITSLPDKKSISSLSLSKEDVSCDFTSSSFDLKIVSKHENVNYRLIKDNLEKEINPEKSKFILKSNKIIIKLYKIKGEYGSYESWTKLTDPKKGSSSTSNGNGSKKKSNDPSASIMEMMKEMYDSGDDNMKKMIGETMMKQRDGTL
eukprot:482955_1